MANLRANNLTGTGGRNAIDGSLYFGGDNDKAGLTIADTTDLELGSETNWTIEFWVKLNRPAISDWDVIMGKGSNDNGGTEYEWFVEVMAANHLVFLSTTAGSPWDFNQQITPVLAIGEWYHVAIVRNGSGSNTLKSYVNGQQYSTHTSQNIYTGNDTFGIGHFAHTNGLNSDVTLSNVRIVKGTSVYTAEFTPPTEKLKPITNTVLLCCQDSDNPTQEATGKTITAYGNLDYSLRDQNLITNGDFDTSATDGWTVASGSAALGTGQSGTFGDGNHLVLTSGTMTQAFTTVIGRTYLVNCQSNGADNSFISTSASSGDAIITDIRHQDGNSKVGSQRFVATQTTYYVILTGGGGGGNFDTVSVYEQESPKAPKVLPPVGIDEGVTFEGDTKINSPNYMYFPTGDTSQRGRGRAVSFAGYLSSPGSTVEEIIYFDIATSGTSLRFGDLGITQGATGAAVASGTRAVYGGGWTSPGVDISYITIATTGNSIDFGANRTGLKGSYAPGLSNSTRGLFISSQNHPNYQALTDYVTIATTGTCTEFGDVVDNRYGGAASASSTRGIYAGGVQGATSPGTNFISYCTIATTGSWANFGDLSNGSGGYRYTNGSSSNTRSIVYGGNYPGDGNEIDYITIATLGDSVDFGDAIKAGTHRGGFSNNIRGGAIGGYYPAADFNTIEYVNIATTGNGIDWGDLTQTRSYNQGTTSDSHGGLS